MVHGSVEATTCLAHAPGCREEGIDAFDALAHLAAAGETRRGRISLARIQLMEPEP